MNQAASLLPERPPRVGELVEVRSRRWLVEGVEDAAAPPTSPRVSLACADDDAQGQELEVFWDCELDRAIVDEEPWSDLGKRGFDSPDHFAAFLNTLRWSCTTATDPSLFQAPFRAGIKIDAYQMEPLRKALLLPRVNLFIADDTGLGKTIEAGLIARELLLRRKVRTIVVAAPLRPSWNSGKQRWRSGSGSSSRFWTASTWPASGASAVSERTRGRHTVASSSLIGYSPTRPTPIRCAPGSARCGAGSLLILDEAHHAAPSHRRAVRHRIKVHPRRARPQRALRAPSVPVSHARTTATRTASRPLLELLDPHRFTRGVKVRGRKDLEAVMVRRLKEDIREPRWAGFPGGSSNPVVIDGLPEDAPELVLSRLLDEYRTLAGTGASPTATSPGTGRGRTSRRGLAAAAPLLDRGVRARSLEKPPEDGGATVDRGCVETTRPESRPTRSGFREDVTNELLTPADQMLDGFLSH